MERVSDPVPRRGFLAAAGTGLLLSLLGCVDDAEDPAPSTTVPDGMPTTAVGVLESADLAPPPEGAQVQLVESTTISEFEAWAVEATFEAPAAELERWMLDSYGDPDGIGRAWVTPQKVKDAMDTEDVPDTWRIEETSIQGTAFERMVLVDDAEPRTVRVRLSEVR